MGCDIHTNVEYRVPVNHKPVWKDGNEYEPNKYYGENEWEPEFTQINELCGGRNYSLFAVLADVRNYGTVIPLAEPRGLPTDCCESIRAEHTKWDSDAHSTSYFSLAELMQALPDYPILQDMIDQLTERYKQLLPQDAVLITPHDIRIVFWFDN